MEPSRSPNRRVPLEDLTNTINQGNQENLDPNARRRQKDRKRYASMSADKKNELNRKRRERYMENKGQDDANSPVAKQARGNQDPHGSRQEDLDSNACRRQRDREPYASMSADKKNELILQYMAGWQSPQNMDICTDAITMLRNFFVDLLAHESNAWETRLPSIIKYYLYLHNRQRNRIDVSFK